jgi:hypothetical protein
MLKQITYSILLSSMGLLWGCTAARTLPVKPDTEPVTLAELADPGAADLEPRAEAVVLEFVISGRDTDLLWPMQQMLKPVKNSETQADIFEHNCLFAGTGTAGELEKFLAFLDTAGARVSKRTNILLFDEQGIGAPVKTYSTREYINYTDMDGRRTQQQVHNAVLEWYVSVTAPAGSVLEYSITPRLTKPQSLIEKRYKTADETAFEWAQVKGLAQNGGFAVLSPSRWPVVNDELADHLFTAGNTQNVSIYCFVFTKVAQ